MKIHLEFQGLKHADGKADRKTGPALHYQFMLAEEVGQGKKM
jgi:hypothetical protein